MGIIRDRHRAYELEQLAASLPAATPGPEYATDAEVAAATAGLTGYVVLTQAAYDALTPDPATLYVIVG